MSDARSTRTAPRRGRSVVAAVALVAGLLAVLPLTGTFADEQQVDTDLVQPGVQRTVVRSAVGGAGVSVSARLQIAWSGTSHVAPGTVVNFVLDPAASTLPSGASASATSVTVPTPWGPGGLAVAAGTTTLTFPSPATPGIRAFHAVWKASPAVTGITAVQDLTILLITTGGPPPADTTPPVLQVPAARTVEATGPSGAVVTYAATAVDAVDGAVTPSCSPASGTTFALGTTTITCTATDTAGNTASGSTTVSVVDTTAPVVGGLTDLEADAAGPDGTEVAFAAPTATDAVDGTLAAPCSPPSGTTFPLGATTVTCTATDAHGNVGHGAFTVRVIDDVAPVLALPTAVQAEATAASGATVAFVASAADAVDGPVTPSCSPASGTTFALGTTTVTCTATDAAANVVSGTFTVTVADTTAPAVTAPGYVVVPATGPDGAVATFTASASDAVGGTRPVTCSAASGTTFAVGDTSVTCTASDAAGNVGTATVVVRVLDDAAPDLDLPADVHGLEAATAAGVPFEYDASALDVVDGALPVTCSTTSGADVPVGTTIVTCTAVDAAGNVATGSFTVEVVDTTAPALDLPEDVTAEATAPAGALVTLSPTALDLVSGLVAVSCDHPSGWFALGTTTVSCTATDDNGNTATGTYDVEVVDTTAPTITAPDDVALEASGATGAVATFGPPEAEDAVDDGVAATCDHEGGTTFPLGTTTVTCSATDASGNTAAVTFAVTIADTTAPDLVLPGPTSVEAADADGSVVDYETTAQDAVGGELEVECDHPSGATFELGETTVSCTATDAAGNTASGTFTVTVVDTTAPHLDLPAGTVDAEATGPTGGPASFTATAADLVDGAVDVSCSQPSGATFPVGATEVTCTAVDVAGNVATGSFVVVVSDTTAPTLDLPTGVTTEATGPTGAEVAFTTAATDVVDGAVLVDCDPPSTSVLPLGATEVTCTAVDSAGNLATGAFTVTVVDTTAPVVSAPGATTVEATGPGGAAVTYEASATDAVTDDVAAPCLPASGALLPLGPNTVTCSATDAAGNTGTATFTVTVADTTAPAVTLPSVALGPVGPTGADATYTGASAADAVDGPVPVTCVPPSGTHLPFGPTTVTCTATDTPGNTATATFTVTVADGTAPTLTLPAGPTAEATGTGGAVVSWTASASDAVDGPVVPVCSPSSGSMLPRGATTVTCTATDAAGNVATGSFTAHVVDTTAPVIPMSGNLGGNAVGPTGLGMQWQLTMSDPVDGTLPIVCTPPSGTIFPVGSVTVHCTATDAAGNVGTHSFSVTIFDPVPPTLSLPANIEVANTAGSAAVTWTATATDDVAGTVPVTCTPASGATFGYGSTTVTCSATDGYNTRSGTFVVTVGTVTRIEFPDVMVCTSCSTTNNGFTYSGSSVGVLNPVTDFACSGGKCAGVLTSRYQFTTTAPARVTVYGMKTDGGCTCRTWNVDYGPDTAYSDLVPTYVDGTFQSPFFTTPILLPGTHNLNMAAYDDASFRPDFLEITTLPAGTGTTPPTITLTGAPVNGTVWVPASNGASVTYAASAKDVYGANLAVTCTNPSGTTFPGGTTTTTCSATDTRGNTASRTFTTKVVTQTTRVEFPDISYSGNGTATTTNWVYSSNGTPITPFADGDCSGGSCAGVYDATYTFTLTAPAVITVYGMRSSTSGCACRTWQVDSSTATSFSDVAATSAASRWGVPLFTTGTIATGTHQLRVHGSSTNLLHPDFLQIMTNPGVNAPTLLVPPQPTWVATTNPSGGTAVTYVTEGIDAYGVALTPSCAPASGATFPINVTTVSCTVTDARGNVTSSSFPVTVAYQGARGEAMSGYVTQALVGGWSQGAGTGTQVPAVTDPRCLNGTCGRFENATFSTTLGFPGKITVYGVRHTGGCACRTWSVNYGAYGSGTFNDGVATTAETQWNVPLFTTGILPAGTYDIQVAAHSGPNASQLTNSTIKVDYAEVVQKPTGWELVPPWITLSGADVNATRITPNPSAFLSYVRSAKDVLGQTAAITCDHGQGSEIFAGTTVTTCTATDEAGRVSTKSFSTTLITQTTRAEVPPNVGVTYSGSLSSPPWLVSAAATTGISVSTVHHPRCSGGYCSTFYTARYTFTLSAPAVVRAYGMATTSGSAGRTWYVNSGAPVAFSDLAASGPASSYRTLLFSTGTLPAGSYNLYMNAGSSPGTLHVDFLDITPT